MALATVADYELITGIDVAAGADTTRITSLIALASSAILAGAHGQQIESATVTGEVIRPFEGVGYFLQRPVTAVSSVVVTYPSGATTTLTANTDYRWTPGGNRRPAMLIRRSAGVDWFFRADETITVTYTAGWSTVPAQITAAVVAMVRAVVVNGADAPRTQTTVGPFTQSIEQTEAQSPTFHLNGPTQSLLDELCGVDGHASLHLTAGS